MIEDSDIPQGEVTSVHDHPTHNFSDRVQLAGDVVPFPVSPQVSDMRRMNNERKIDSYASKLNRPHSDIVKALDILNPGKVVKGPGAND